MLIAMTLLGTLGALPTVTAMAAPPEAAQPKPCLGRVGGEVYCAGGRSGGSSGGRSGGYVPERRDRTYYAVAADGGCYRVHGRALRPGERRVSVAQVMAAQPAGARRCPPGGQSTRDWQELVRLPKPVLTFEPSGTALVGKRVYVVIGGVEAADVNTADVRISAKPVQYRIAWGDGAVTTTADSGQGYPVGPAPNTHVYRAAGQHTVAVTVMWDVLAGPTGQLEQLQLETTDDATVIVNQGQAVRQS
ncbi:MAG: hypothetical protein ACRD0K_09025 [Egibacteraceae bacterium]